MIAFQEQIRFLQGDNIVVKNCFYLANPNWYKENFIIAKRNDADSCCKELYDDLANTFFTEL